MSENMNANKMLGYPVDARLLIVNADDFGLCYAQNIGTILSIKDGLVSSCSLMTPAPWSLHAAHFLQENLQVPFGVHLTVVSEYAHYRWRPLSLLERVPSLVDESGYFLADDRITDLLHKADLDELEREFRTQIEAAISFGLEPTHLDSHYNIHESRDDIFGLTVHLALEYGLAVRVGTRANIEKLQGSGYPANDHAFLDSGRIKPDDKASVLAERLRELPSGLSEWALHPGIATEELRAVMADPKVEGGTGTPQGRQSDFDFITSNEAAALVKEEGIEVLSYKSLQRFWQIR